MSIQNNSQPLVSVIMNCYYGETYLRESINSIITQTYKNWELIFWDNRSDDKSAEVFKSYTDQRLKYYYAPKHTTLYTARNFAIEKSKGTFIAFLDTDDYWDKNKLDLQLPLFSDPQVGVVYGNHFIINENLKTKRVFLRGKKPKGYIMEKLLKNYCTSLVTLVIRKSFLDNYKPPFDSAFHIMGDFDLMIRMSSKYKFNCVEKPIAFYRSHGKNESILKKNYQAKELKIWCIKMKNYPNIFNNKNFLNISNIIDNTEVVDLILARNYDGARSRIKKMPNSLKKIKYLIALILPYNFVKKFIQS